MKDYQQRVVKEKAELDEKLEKLGAFLKGGAASVDPEERARMSFQHLVMTAYSNVLTERIAAFK